MSMRHTAIAALTLLLLAGLPALAQTTEPPQAQAAAEPAAVPACGDCHELAKAFTANAHARGKTEKGADGTAVVPNAVCESCHGSGAAHIESGGEKDKIYKPAGLAGADKTCLQCHDLATQHVTRRAGMHSNTAAVNCLSCHSIHAASREPHLLAKPQLALCNTCHSTQVASFRNLPYAHRVGRAGMNCSSCHEPHGRPARESLRLSQAGEVACAECHADKRGPFVFQHGSFAIGECTTCHEAHGSANPKRLKRANVWQLCIECHSPIEGTTLGAQPPSFHNLSDPRYRNCTTCHVAIHGSNRSPQLLK